MKKLFLFLIISFPIVALYSQSTSEEISVLKEQLDNLDKQKEELNKKLENLKLVQLRSDLKQYGLPKIIGDEELIEHAAMSLVYNEFHEQAKWVAHIITPDIINGKQGRSNDFRPDSLVKTGTAIESDYFLKYLQEDSTYEYDGFGYDRGHLAPSADFRWSQKALSESYLYSNMSPQLPEFNRESWAELEGLLRGYIYENPNTQLYVVTGPILRKDLPHIERGTNKVSIPEQFFKVVIDLKNNRGIGFLMPNQKMHYPISSYVKSIDEIEELSGIDFYHKLDDSLENKLEKQLDASTWFPEKNQKDVDPLYAPDLPPNYFNTIQAKIYTDDFKEVNICGKIVSTKITRNGHIFMNVDKTFPNQVFTIAIWKKNHPNFSYDIIKEWEGKTVCVTGNVVEFGGTPTMIIDKENQIKEYSKTLWKE